MQYVSQRFLYWKEALILSWNLYLSPSSGPVEEVVGEAPDENPEDTLDFQTLPEVPEGAALVLPDGFIGNSADALLIEYLVSKNRVINVPSVFKPAVIMFR